jgi:GNAT superfamily N-acetyltransferase
MVNSVDYAKINIRKVLEMEENTVRQLTIGDIDEIRDIDIRSGAVIALFIKKYNIDYAYGIFVQNHGLIGYCTVGMDDIDYEDWSPLIKDKEFTMDSLILGDVYIKDEFRNKGYCKLLIRRAIELRWRAKGHKSPVYLYTTTDDIIPYYESLGFNVLDNKRFMKLTDLKYK